MKPFQLQFDSLLIPDLAKRYSFQEDAEAFSAGEEIRSGQHTRANLDKIFEWKTNGRGRSRLAKNTDKDIADALRLAIDAKTDRAAVAVLLGLNGVQVPVASAVLTAINPERFTIIDFRALQALSVVQPAINVDFYLAYLRKCRELAKENGVSLRTLDRALWQWSKENS
jgi:thermostable 8-oxoguanine DNA glycosylase